MSYMPAVLRAYRGMPDFAKRGFRNAVSGPIIGTLFNNWESNALQRSYNQYLKKGYERQLNDYNKNVGRQIRYPELSYAGRIRAMDTGISQSYIADSSATNSAVRSLGVAAGSAIGGRSRSLYGRSSGRSSRYL